jgi:hypothetical protein
VDPRNEKLASTTPEFSGELSLVAAVRVAGDGWLRMCASPQFPFDRSGAGVSSGGGTSSNFIALGVRWLPSFYINRNGNVHPLQ